MKVIQPPYLTQNYDETEFYAPTYTETHGYLMSSNVEEFESFTYSGDTFTLNDWNDTTEYPANTYVQHKPYGIYQAIGVVPAKGGVMAFTITGEATGTEKTYYNVSASGGSGSGATFEVTVKGNVYTIKLTTPGSNYSRTETLTIAGTAVGGASTANDITITLTDVSSGSSPNLNELQWLFIQSTNPVAMFDTRNDTQSIRTGSGYIEIDVLLKTLNMDSVGLINLYAGRVDLTIYADIDPTTYLTEYASNPSTATPPVLRALPDWNINSDYVAGEFVLFEGITYRTTVNITGGSNQDPKTEVINTSNTWETYVGNTALVAWNSGDSYIAGDCVTYSNNIYVALTTINTGVTTDPSASSDWQLYNYSTYPQTWSNSNSYTRGDFVEFYGVFYVAKQNVPSASLVEQITDTGYYQYWTEFNPFINTSLKGTTYLTGDSITDWYEYFFNSDYTTKTTVFTLGQYAGYNTTYLRARIGGSDTVGVGNLVFGRVRTIGETEYDVTTGITDYSVKETNEFGVTRLLQRAYSKRISANVLIGNGQLNAVQRLLYDIRATAVLWVASINPQFDEPLVVFGYYKDFQTDIKYPTYSYCSLEIEGLI